ncbi:DUF6515 family protein [Desulfosarcina cetonica]|uniref:DUF6515 family protein n=1 Tax=Desulfosarcina cetonica TaxID=90730 RepID=UPI0006CF7F0E|nr:DUF6515 family protein [Desulfosarcina cetonica]
MTRFYLKRNTGWRNLTIALLVVGLVAGSSAWAGPPMNRSHGDYPQEGQYRQSIPADHQRVRMGGDPMVFHKGVYYRHDPRGYRVVRPPRGTKIDHLPLGVETLLIAGVTYFLLAGIYYQKAPSGYVVVDAPASAPPSPTMAAGQVLAVDTALLNVRSGPPGPSGGFPGPIGRAVGGSADIRRMVFRRLARWPHRLGDGAIYPTGGSWCPRVAKYRVQPHWGADV